MKKGMKKENGRVKKLQFRFTEDEADLIKEEAKKKNMNVSEYIRYLIDKEIKNDKK